MGYSTVFLSIHNTCKHGWPSVFCQHFNFFWWRGGGGAEGEGGHQIGLFILVILG